MSGSMVSDTRAFLKDIRLEHSLFALPFAALGLLMGSAWLVEQGLRASVWPTGRELLWFLVAMVGTR
ncbi:MAG: hypothetical protein HYU66_28260, partial [Armatimonadetes bacterium]|nr:hypothetical protein [Armatimonadota bacterium]